MTMDLQTRPVARRRLTGPLTTRELVILESLDRDRTLRQIAADLFVTRNTVKSQVRSVYRKLGVTTRADALAVARRDRLL
jgi:LuxR family transcriptional regulator, transcriptional regulator of spore coat protein